MINRDEWLLDIIRHEILRISARLFSDQRDPLAVEKRDLIQSLEVLFLEFAESEPSDAGMCRFFSRLAAVASESAGAPPKPMTAKSLESLAGNWADNVLDLRACVNVWRCLGDRMYSELASHFKLGEGKGGSWTIVYDSHPTLPKKSNPPAPDLRWIDRVELGRMEGERIPKAIEADVSMAAHAYLIKKINDRMRRCKSTGLAWNSSSNRVEDRDIPKDFITALWLQLKDAYSGREPFIRCRQCAKWFRINSFMRSDREYCSDSCKVKYYRARKLSVLELAKLNRNFTDISRETGVEREKVKEWVEEWRRVNPDWRP